MAALLRTYEMPFRILTSQSDQEEIAFHYYAQSMHTKLLSEKDIEINYMKKKRLRRKIEESTVKGNGFSPLLGSMKVSEFAKKMLGNSQFIVNNIFEYTRYFDNDDRSYKHMREECWPIYAYLKHVDIENDADISLDMEKGKCDACISRINKEDIIIEVTQAVPRNSHRFRQAMMDGFKVSLELEERTNHQKGKDEFPLPIVTAINKKHRKNYPESRVLLVSVLGEYSDEDDIIISEWIKSVRKQTNQGNFDSIYLFELARSKLYQIFPPS